MSTEREGESLCKKFVHFSCKSKMSGDAKILRTPTSLGSRQSHRLLHFTCYELFSVSRYLLCVQTRCYVVVVV